MVINARKFQKIKSKIETKLIGTYGSSTGLGNDIVINKYNLTFNNYGDATQALSTTVTAKAIDIGGFGLNLAVTDHLEVAEDEVILYISIDIVLKPSTATIKYEFVFEGDTYELVRERPLGRVANLDGVIREIVIKKIV